jgi:phosphoribosylanthranilate isomerase
MTLVKICGITNVEDARLATRLGCDALGFNFYAVSPRSVAPDLVREIISEVGDRVQTAGVFVNEPVDDLLRTAEATGIDSVQLHGDETPEYVNYLRGRCDLNIWKAFRISREFDRHVIERYEIDAILIDAYSPDVFGGSGRMTDRSVAKKIAARYPKVYLAGGLTPENVKASIESVRPFAVDVATGVESARGRKDATKLEDFIRNAKNA